MKGFFQKLYVIHCAGTFITIFLILFPLFCICAFLGNWGRHALWVLLKFMAAVWFPVIGMPVKRIYEAKPVKGKSYIVVANHISYLDPPLIVGGLNFYARPLAKFELGKIPLFGVMYKAFAVVIDRSNDASKEAGVQLLEQTLKKDNTSIFIFPEGTFNETSAPLAPFFNGAFKIALDTNTDILPVLFLDSKDRMPYTSIWKMTPGRNRVVYLPEIKLTEKYKDNLPLLKEDTYKLMESYLLRYQNT